MRRRFFFILIGLIATSLLLNLFLLFQLVELGRRLQVVSDSAGYAIEAAAGQLEAAAAERIEFSVDISQTIPIRTEIAISETLEIPINTDVPIDTTIQIPIDLGPLGRTNLDVPIVATVPVDVVVPVVIDRTVPVSADIPINLQVPIDIAIADTPFAEALLEWAARLREFRASMGPPTTPAE